MVKIARRFWMTLALFSPIAAALMSSAPLASAQGVAVPAPDARLGAPLTRGGAAPVPPDAVKAPAAPAVPATGAPAPLAVPADAAPIGDGPPATSAEQPAAPCANPKPAVAKMPGVQITPRTGFFAVPPTGPGYYSLLDNVTGVEREKPPPSPYPRSAIMSNSFFDADFSYVDQPGYKADLLEKMHRIHIGDDWLFATGGEFRYRLANEVNSRLSGTDNRYDLTRLRVFGDLWYRDTFRLYVEFISAQSFNQDLPPVLIDRNYADLLNAFIQVKIFEGLDGTPWYVRGGRQEMLLGSQRLVSPLDWANTRRTFDGVRVFKHSEKWDIDAFWTRPVIPNVSRFDNSDPKQNFGGLFTEYRPNKNQALDLYYFYLDDRDAFSLATKTPLSVGNLPTAPYTVHTLGYRYSGNMNTYKNVLFDSENMLQLGHSGFTNSDIVAGSSSTGVGYNFAKMPMNPTVWAYFDYASGSRSATGGSQLSTFNQLYPFGHYYFGWLDFVGRQNIQDTNFNLYLYPTKWITFNMQYHIFTLDSATDALYNAGGGILRYDPTGQAGRNVGQEMDFIMNFHLTARQDVLVAYGHLWEGSFLRQTGTSSFADSFWLMYTVRW